MDERKHAGLSKKERIYLRAEVSQLFRSRQHVFSFPLKLIYQLVPHRSEAPSYCRFLVTVPKRTFKRAVDRNLLKRRVREAYRHNKQPLYDVMKRYNMDRRAMGSEPVDLLVGFIFVGDVIKSYASISTTVALLLDKLANTIEQPLLPFVE